MRHRVPSPYFGAGLAFVLCLAGYGFSISPTVTFWDAGEFLAASKVLGVPHPPGTPIFVFLSNSWARLFPFGEFAFRVGMMTAVLGALTVALAYLVVFEAMTYRRVLQKKSDFWMAHAASFAGAMVSAFAFTVWQNANEAEVYMLAAAVVMTTAVLVLYWRRARGTPTGAKCLLVTIYLFSLSVGIHLLGLLVGPALIVFVWLEIQTNPHENPEVRRLEFGQLAVIVAAWLMLVAVGLGNRSLMIIGALSMAVALAISLPRGASRFWLAALVVSAVGVSTYAFIYLRAGLAPTINVGDASTWERLLALISRQQYPPRLPWDNPIFLSGPDNPGRSLELVWLQILNYLQYFDWQWSRGLAAAQTFMAWQRLPITLAFISLGVYGASILHERDRSTFWLLLCLFLVTGPGLVAYMNFKPGFSIGYDRFPTFAQHEVRERDYFFLLSFQTWGLWVGVAIATACNRFRGWLKSYGVAAVVRTLASAMPYGLVLLPIILNHAVANRNKDPEARLAIDFAYDLLQSIEPYGVLITGGDNDTYPLWYAQEVLGVRRDVTVVVTPLCNADWYIRQMRDRQVRPFDAVASPWFASLVPDLEPPPLHSMTDAQVASLRSVLLPESVRFQAGVLDRTLEAGTPLYGQDQVILRLIQENVDRRPVYFATSSGSSIVPMFRDSIVREGLVYRLYADREPESSRLGAGVDGYRVDIERTQTLTDDVYRYAGLFEADINALGTTERRIVVNFGSMLLALGTALDSIGDRNESLRVLERAEYLLPDSGIRGYVESLR